MLKTVKHGSGIREDPPPCFFKIPTFSRFFLGGASLMYIDIYIFGSHIIRAVDFIDRFQEVGRRGSRERPDGPLCLY